MSNSPNQETAEQDGLVASIADIPDSAVMDVPSSFEQILSGDADAAITDEQGAFNLAAYAERSYLEYAISVVKGRSLPEVTDGQKPVQRRILFAMKSMGLSATSKHIKSARVVGEVMGKLHPHGDSSIYDAMVLSAQDFSRRYPLVDGQGNFGSRDGDGAAAMRYTEARLTPIADLLLSEVDSGTVDFVPNYDGAFTEPACLPARLPFVLMNGAKGAAVGYAVEIPSHNLREVSNATTLLIRNPQASIAEIMECLPAPDFPGGGQIISPRQTLVDIYTSGRGGLRMRARWKREELARGQWRIVVTELPHGVSAAGVLAEIEAATNPQPRQGKKELTQEQKNVKALILSLLDGARDESDQQQPVRLVLEPKTSKTSEDEMMAALLAQTSLESSVPVNLVVIGRDGNPKQKNIKDILTEWIDFRFVTVRRRTQHRLDQVMRRLHILEGRMLAFLRIEEVIRIIRDSDEPRAALMEKIGLSEVQAEDILEIRLRQLARLEGIRIEKEAQELREEEKHLRHLLDNQEALTSEILKEIEADTRKYGDDRRTLVETVDPVRVSEVSAPDEPVTVMVSRNGWLRSRQGHGVDRSTIAWKQSDEELAVLETRTTHPIIIIDTKGRAYTLRASAIPGGRGDGIPLSSLVDLQDGAKVTHVLTDAPSASYLFTNSGSYGFITQIKELESKQRAGKAFLTLETGEEILAPSKVGLPSDWIAACSRGPKESRMVLFPVSEMKVMPKGRGVIVMGLDAGEKLALCQIYPVASADASPHSVTVKVDSGQEVTLRGEELKKFLLHRARKGCQLSKRSMPVALS